MKITNRCNIVRLKMLLMAAFFGTLVYGFAIEYAGSHIREWRIARLKAALKRANPGWDDRRVSIRLSSSLWCFDSVYFDRCSNLRDLSPLAGHAIINLTVLGYSGKGIAFVRGMPLERFGITGGEIDDLSPLKGMRLKSLGIGENEGRLSDISVVCGMPLKELFLGDTAVTDLSPVAGLPLKRFSVTSHDNYKYRQGFEPRKFGFNRLTDISVLRGMQLNHLCLSGTNVSDLSPLNGMPLKVLQLNYTPVADLTLLEGMQLRQLYLNKSKVSDLGSLRGMPLNVLFINGTKVSDLSPLKGDGQFMALGLKDTPVKDISPLSNIRIINLYLNRTLVEDLSPLKKCDLIFLDIRGTPAARKPLPTWLDKIKVTVK